MSRRRPTPPSPASRLRPWSVALVVALAGAHLSLLDALAAAAIRPTGAADTAWLLFLLVLWSLAFGLILAAVINERDRRDLEAWYTDDDDEDDDEDEEGDSGPPHRWLH